MSVRQDDAGVPSPAGPPAFRPPGAPAPGPPPGTDVWLIPLDEPGAEGTAPALTGTGALSAAEQQRARNFRDPAARRRYTMAHAATRVLLGQYLDVPGRMLRWSVGPRGKPHFEGEHAHWHWNLSRSRGYALLAVSRTTPVGVDIEHIHVPERSVLSLAARYLPPPEAARVAAEHSLSAQRVLYHRFLARKEACVKATGGRLLAALGLPVAAPGPVREPPGRRGAQWILHDLPAPAGHVAAVATLGADPGPVRLFVRPAPRTRGDRPAGAGCALN